MPKIRTILAATALTDRAAFVPQRAALLARLLGVPLVLATVVPASTTGAKRFRLTPRKLTRDSATAQLDALAATMPDVAVTTVVREGPVAPTVAELVAEHDAGLVVLGLHKERMVLDTLRLTTMEQITLAVPCPVLVAHQETIAPYRRVLGAVTFAPASAHAMAVAARIAEGAEFHAIHALEMTGRDLRTGTSLHDSAVMTEAHMLRDAFLQLPDLPAQLHLPEIIPGGVHEVISYRIAELQPDLLVIGSHSGRNPKTLGNYARDLMRAPPTDLLIAKPV